MTRPHWTAPGGQPLDLIGRPLHPGRGSLPGILIVEKGIIAMPKADANGTYTDANGNRFRIHAGDELPEGATMDSGEVEVADEPEPEERAKGAAPENRAKADKAEKR